MSDMRCDRCNHWQNAQIRRNHNAAVADLGMGICILAELFWDATEWSKDVAGNEIANERGNTVRRVKPANAHLKMFVQDGSDYDAYLITKPDFFCAHFEIKR